MSDKGEAFLELLRDSIIEGRFSDARDLIDETVNRGIKPEELIETTIKPALEMLGEMFERGEVYLPTLVSASKLLDGLICDSSADPDDAPTIIMGTVSSDIHEIGKNICVSMARCHGYRVEDLGNDVPSEKFISSAIKKEATAIAVSSTMKSTLKYQDEITVLASERDIPVLVGGASCSEKWCNRIGAAGYSQDCVSFVSLLDKVSGS